MTALWIILAFVFACQFALVVIYGFALRRHILDERKREAETADWDRVMGRRR